MFRRNGTGTWKFQMQLGLGIFQILPSKIVTTKVSPFFITRDLSQILYMVYGITSLKQKISFIFDLINTNNTHCKYA